MPLLNAARIHFDEDIARARSLIAHAQTLAEGILQDDIKRAGWMFGVGALDALFCDAYADLISRTLRAKEFQPSARIPDKLANLKVPVIAILEEFQYQGWRWRMAARELMEKNSVLSFAEIKTLFNVFFDDTDKLFSDQGFDVWLAHPDAKVRLFGVHPNVYRSKAGTDKTTTRSRAKKKFELYFDHVFQRRHDCIHNCDRPKMALQRRSLEPGQLEKKVDDVEFLVKRLDERLVREFPLYLTRHGFNAVTRNRVCG